MLSYNLKFFHISMLVSMYMFSLEQNQKEIDTYQKKYFELKEQKTKINEPSATGTRKKKSNPTT